MPRNARKVNAKLTAWAIPHGEKFGGSARRSHRTDTLNTRKDPLGKDETNPVPNTNWSSGVCWRAPVKC